MNKYLLLLLLGMSLFIPACVRVLFGVCAVLVIFLANFSKVFGISLIIYSIFKLNKLHRSNNGKN